MNKKRTPDGLCSVDDCGSVHRAGGFCRKHYARWKAHGDPNVVLLGGRRPEPKESSFVTMLPAAPLQEVLKQIAARQGLATLARKMGVNPDQLSHIAHHNTTVRWETADKICCAMKMHPVELWPHEWTAAA